MISHINQFCSNDFMIFLFITYENCTSIIAGVINKYMYNVYMIRNEKEYNIIATDSAGHHPSIIYESEQVHIHHSQEREERPRRTPLLMMTLAAPAVIVV